MLILDGALFYMNLISTNYTDTQKLLCYLLFVSCYMFWRISKYTVCLLSFRTGIIKSICVKEMTLLLFRFRHTSLLTVHTHLHGHTASGCLCRSRPLQWCLMYLSRLSGSPNWVKETPLQVGFHFWEQNVISGWQIWQIRRVVEHSHFSMDQKLLDDCRVVGRGVVVQKEPVTRFTCARSDMSNSV
jgi:hypothetical protein